MLFLELPLILLEDGMVLLELDMFGLQALDFLKDLGQFSHGSISGHGSLESLTLHHKRVFTKDQELLVFLGQSLIELGVLLLGFNELLSQVLYPLLCNLDLLGIIVQ